MKTVLKAFFIFFLGLFFASCSQKNQEKDKIYDISVTDFRGEEINLEAPVENAVCLIESALSGIYMLEAGDRIIAVPSSVYDEELFKYYSQLDNRILEKKLPSPGNWDFISIEGIIDLNPDLVIIWSSQIDAIKALERLNIKVYAVMLNSFDDIYKEISDFGILFGKEKRADSLINFTKSNLKKIKKRNKTLNKKRAYFMWAQGINETSGINSTVNELFNHANVVNVCDLNQEHLSISIERLYDWDPDIIIMWYNEKLDPEDVISDPLLQRVKAVKEGQVYELPGVFASDFWTLKLLNAVGLISQWSYPSSPVASLNLKKVYKFLYNADLTE